MKGETADPDLPPRSGLVGRLHMGLGRLAILTRLRFSLPLSLGVKLLATNAAGEVLLVRHSYVPGLALPGGAVEPGETTREAAVREAIEETGVEIPDPPRLFHVYLNRALANRDHIVLYTARDVRQPRPPGPRPEILSARFYDPANLPEDVTPATRARIAEVLEEALPSDHW